MTVSLSAYLLENIALIWAKGIVCPRGAPATHSADSIFHFYYRARAGDSDLIN